MRNLRNIEIADDLLSRGLGLIGRRDWGKYEGMLIKSTNAIHTFFVLFSIDVVFLDEDFKIVRVTENLRPFWFSPIVWRAKHVLELPVGTVRKKTLAISEKINLI